MVGSRSGRHSGRLAAYSNSDGASFLPVHGFAAGELVRVRVRVVSGAGARTVSSLFRIAHQAHISGIAAGISRRTRAAVAPARAPQAFHSRPDLKPPQVLVTTATPQAAPGDVFITPTGGASQAGPMIFDDAGQVVWFKPLPHQAATDLKVQSYAGRQVLTWWQGRIFSLGFGAGEDVISDDSYRTVATVRAGNGYQTGLHDFQLTPGGGALIMAFDPVRESLASVRGPRDGQVLDGVIQEVDVKTGLVMWEWHSLRDVALTESYAAPHAGVPLDYFHVNSIEEMPGGDLLVSARNTWTVYDVRRASGAVLWRLGGKRSSFKMGSGTGLAYQHDARLQPDGTITVFDNGGAPKVHSQSRAIRIALDFQHRTARLIARYVHPTPLISGSQGDTQVLEGNNVFVGWGEAPFFSEFSATGALVFDAHVYAPGESYRAFRFRWRGHPLEPPAVAVAPAGGTAVSVYASWNGTTDVASWQVLAGPTPTTLTPVATMARTGFETSISLASAPQYVAVRALDASGAVLGTSATITS